MAENPTQFATTKMPGDDLGLVHASKKGNVTAFEQLVKRYDRRLLRVSLRVTRNREDSEDAVQEALLKAFPESGRIPRRFAVLNLVDPHHREPVPYEAAKTDQQRDFFG
jgi:hypothetical protein